LDIYLDLLTFILTTVLLVTSVVLLRCRFICEPPNGRF